MNEAHRFYLNIGSNIEPEINLPKAIDLLEKNGNIKAISNAWQSHPIGASGPDFINACVLFFAPSDSRELKERVIKFIEASLGRVRGSDKNAPRTIDLDIIMVDDKPINLERWNNPFVVLPMAELEPELIHPNENEMLWLIAERMRAQTWIVQRPDILKASVDPIK
jgi:2-amino-4-hydroxy-6-hydroxymethyldihydropteridine diphosphokinase